MTTVDKPTLRIVFMGTPDFAVASLQTVHEAGYPIVAVITAPDKPSGRGMQMHMSAVKRYAVAHALPIFQPERLKDPAFLAEVASLNPDLGVVVAFRMLPEVLWSMPRLGTFNLHASLLPCYRGAAPINWALINGETETGVTTFFLKHAIDTGDVVLQEKEPIAPDDTYGSLYARLMEKGAQLVLKTVRMVQNGTLATKPQEATGEWPLAPKLTRETGQLKWTEMTTEQIHGLVRGLSPVPGAYTYYLGKQYKLLKGYPASGQLKALSPGEWYNVDKRMLFIGTRNGWFEVKEIQPEGKKAMRTDEFLRGFKLS